MKLKDLRISASGYTPRTELFEGEPHLVVPVVALVEGVVHAMNAPLPEFVAAREFSKQPAGWNGRPIFEGHPMINGKPVSGNLPQVLADKKIGTVFNAHAPSGKLAMEAWLHVKRCARLAPVTLARAKAGEPIEISIGTFVDTDDVVGEHNGKAYRGSWKNMVADHLALLPEGTPGACSREMGCGVRYAQDASLLEDLIGNGNNQYTQGNAAAGRAAHQAAASAHKVAGDAHAKAFEEHSTVVSSLHESRDRAAETSAAAMHLSDTAEEATIATEADHRDANASRSSDHAYQAANRASNLADHEPGGPTAFEHAAASSHHYEAEKAHTVAMKNLRAAIGNGNNQYTHGNAAAAHEKASSAHRESKTALAAGQGTGRSEAAISLSHDAMDATLGTSLTGAESKVAALDRASGRLVEKLGQNINGDTRTTGIREHERLAQLHDQLAKEHMSHMSRNAQDFRDARDISQATRDTYDASDFAGPNESFPIKLPVDVGNAAQALGRAKGDRAAIKRRIVAIAYRKGDTFVAQLPDDWKRKVDASRNASLFARLMTAARAAFRPAQNADEMSDVDLKRDLLEALQEIEPTVAYVEAYHPVTDPTHVVYCVNEPPDADDLAMTGGCCGPTEQTWYERPFTLSPAGTITLGDARVEVEPVMRYEPVEGATPETDEPEVLIGNGNNQYSHANAAAMHERAAAFHQSRSQSRNAAAGAPGSSGTDAHNNDNQETDMQKNEVLKALEGATDCQLAAIGTILKPRSEAEIRAAVAKEASDKDVEDKARKEEIRVAVEAAVAAAKPKDFDAVLAQAPAEIKSAFKAAADAVAARKVAALKSLEGKDTGFSKEELDAKDGVELEKIAKLAGVPRAAIDFGAQGVNGVGAVNTTEAPAAPDLGASIRAARAAAKK